MSSTVQIQTPKSFWLLAGAALVWNLLGVASYIQHVTLSEAALAKLSEAERALYLDMPVWVTAAFAVAVFAGLAGSAALLLKSRYALHLFTLSLVAVVAQFSWFFVFSKALSVLPATAAIMPSVIFVIAAALVWFSLQARAKGRLR